MPGRNENSDKYRYGFNGKEKDQEGEFGSITNLDFGARIYNPAIGKFLSVDPVPKSYESPYISFANNPIWYIDPNGADTTLYDQQSGVKLDTKFSDSELTPIWIVDQDAEGYNRDDPWATARPLTYQVGEDTDYGGLTGKTFRPYHPLCGSGPCFEEEVYEEDLIDMTTEFQSLVAHNLPVFTGIAGGLFPDIRFRALVNDGKKFDLKSTIVTDGTPSYAAKIVGEWSFFNGTLRRYDDYGNISYGAFGKKAGFTSVYLRFGANINQWGKDLFGDTDGTGDEPRDVKMINLGFKLYEQGYFNIK